jgi:endosialidase-like protein
LAPDDDATTEKIAKLRGVTWEWREDALADAKEQPGMGVIAQEVEKVFPELVTTDDQGRKKVEYEGLIAPLIEAVKELDERVRSLEAEIAALRGAQRQG